MIKSLFPVAVMATALAAAPAALATENDSTAVEGTYLLVQPNDSQRALALNPGGVASLISQGQQVRGYTSGLGSWQMTGPDTARANIIDFNPIGAADDGNGASHSVFELSFSDKVDGKFRNLSGQFSGKAFDRGQNPLNDDAEPARMFSNEVEGSRIGVDRSGEDQGQLYDNSPMMVVI
ncbi:MAG: hypothetical protein AAF724_02350 [Pseudomonadota bacterium]